MSLSSAVLSLVLLQGVPGSSPNQLADTLGAVSRNVKESQDQLPDFLCNEKVTSTTFKSGKKQSERSSNRSSVSSSRVNIARSFRSMENRQGKG
jgi:hypothetical protein